MHSIKVVNVEHRIMSAALACNDATVRLRLYSVMLDLSTLLYLCTIVYEKLNMQQWGIFDYTFKKLTPIQILRSCCIQRCQRHQSVFENYLNTDKFLPSIYVYPGIVHKLSSSPRYTVISEDTRYFGMPQTGAEIDPTPGSPGPSSPGSSPALPGEVAGWISPRVFLVAL